MDDILYGLIILKKGKKFYQKSSLTCSLLRNATIPTKISPIMKLPFDVKYISDQSQIARHRKTTANNPSIAAHLSLLLRLLSSFGSMTSVTAVSLLS
jgi:hypothetical protein